MGFIQQQDLFASICITAVTISFTLFCTQRGKSFSSAGSRSWENCFMFHQQSLERFSSDKQTKLYNRNMTNGIFENKKKEIVWGVILEW